MVGPKRHSIRAKLAGHSTQGRCVRQPGPVHRFRAKGFRFSGSLGCFVQSCQGIFWIAAEPPKPIVEVITYRPYPYTNTHTPVPIPTANLSHLPCPTLPCPTLPYPTRSYSTLPDHHISYHITSCHIISRHKGT